MYQPSPQGKVQGGVGLLDFALPSEQSCGADQADNNDFAANAVISQNQAIAAALENDNGKPFSVNPSAFNTAANGQEQPLREDLIGGNRDAMAEPVESSPSLVAPLEAIRIGTTIAPTAYLVEYMLCCFLN